MGSHPRDGSLAVQILRNPKPNLTRNRSVPQLPDKGRPACWATPVTQVWRPVLEGRRGSLCHMVIMLDSGLESLPNLPSVTSSYSPSPPLVPLSQQAEGTRPLSSEVSGIHDFFFRCIHRGGPGQDEESHNHGILQKVLTFCSLCMLWGLILILGKKLHCSIMYLVHWDEWLLQLCAWGSPWSCRGAGVDHGEGKRALACSLWSKLCSPSRGWWVLLLRFSCCLPP